MGHSQNRFEDRMALHGMQRRMVLVDDFVDFLKIFFFCLFVALCDLVLDVETIFHLP